MNKRRHFLRVVCIYLQVYHYRSSGNILLIIRFALVCADPERMLKFDTHILIKLCLLLSLSTFAQCYLNDAYNLDQAVFYTSKFILLFVQKLTLIALHFIHFNAVFDFFLFLSFAINPIQAPTPQVEKYSHVIHISMLKRCEKVQIATKLHNNEVKKALPKSWP